MSYRNRAMYKYANNQPNLYAATDLSKFKPELDPKYRDFRYTPYATIGAGGIAALIAYLRSKRRGDSLGNRIGQALKWGAGVGALGYLGGQGLDHLYWRPKNLINTVKNHPASKETVPTLAQRVGWVTTPRWYDLFSPRFTPTLGLDPNKSDDVIFQNNWVRANRELDNLRVPDIARQYNVDYIPSLGLTPSISFGYGSDADAARQWLVDMKTGFADAYSKYQASLGGDTSGNADGNVTRPTERWVVRPAKMYDQEGRFLMEDPILRHFNEGDDYFSVQ